MSVGKSSSPALPPELGVRELIGILDAALSGVPQTTQDSVHRFSLVQSLRNSLGRFGIDGESLVRYGMAPRAAAAIYRALFSPNDDDLTQIIDTARWRELLRVPVPSARLDELDDVELDAMSSSLHRVPFQLQMWVANAKFADIVRFSPPNDKDWSDWSLRSRESEETVAAYEWLWQRNTGEVLDRWSTDTLHLEYKWQHNRKVSLFSPEALSDDGPELPVLNAEIARRAVEPQSQGQHEQDRLLWQLQESAVDFLRKGKFSEAVALFEFHRRRNPQDPKTLNNLGFCSMPLGASRALHWLELAAANNYGEVAINVYNQCCCLVQLNRAAEALDRAENYWQRQRQVDAMPGFLWVEKEDKWELNGDSSPEAVLADLAIEAAKALGLPSRVARWEERKKDVASAFAADDLIHKTTD